MGLPLPEGYEWSDIQYVIGGWGWKSRYLNKSGYFITWTGKNRDVPGKNQYNTASGKWLDYHPGETKPYDCGGCHTTGYSSEGHQDGLEGLIGTWAYPGVQCERCHGPGSEHIAKGGGKGVAISVNRSADFCGECHSRGKDTSKIPAKNGFVRHHEQYQDFLSSGKMAQQRCVDCHDPHKPVHPGKTNTRGEGYGIKKGCESCHPDTATAYQGSVMEKADVKCIDCHMPKAAVSAEKASEYVGDVRSHLFRINHDPKAEFTYKAEDGKEYASGYLTLDFACLSCHEGKDKAWAAQYAVDSHVLGKVKETSPPVVKETQPPTPVPEKGVCGPTALLALALLPLGMRRWRRRGG